MPSTIDRLKSILTGGSNPARERQRRELKTQLATLQAQAGHEQAILKQLRAIGDRERKAVRRHEETCRPHQAELQSIEKKISDLILAGKEIPTDLARRRGKHLDAVAESNVLLETEIDSLKKLRKSLNAQRKNSQTANKISEIRGQLKSDFLACPDMRVARFVNRCEIQWLDKRLADARHELESAEDALWSMQRNREQHQITNSYGQRVSGIEPGENELRQQLEVNNWRAEVQAAEQERAAAVQRKQLIAEAIEAE